MMKKIRLLNKSEYPISLSDAWLLSCHRLWHLCEKYSLSTKDVTIWDAFKLLYLDSVPDLGAGKKAKGVNNVFTN